ncbi:hypothetical protein acsn021_32440 [Anaerocolumna cellulosilytica]|uniref:Uncharacterized protein n=1 Tax=Anaerocolumna cellulosilytica TaxID=433286 RepID=A0A6S6R924_9FIRM|nr:hypothetical protein [Anaerocolumna cellulosilytica]MBB5196574.1 hypothetical protein [Anaerocolumna cellulosilytica]BCJ95675.1 hypothetical protein acsn021_32440 [Anaerocolumna cellulosilytica]
MGKIMTFDEYKLIITEAVKEYCDKGGSLLNIALEEINKEYLYEFDEPLPEDLKKHLIDKAHQAMKKERDLPPGIRLSKVIFKG